jgi:TolB-like protein/DNA-binding winged helix-turn-helix (wHTH) protein/Tfp pilus assembly protein PilF
MGTDFGGPAAKDQRQTVFRFGLFELNLQAGELRRQGQKIKLQDKPFQALSLLLEHAGEVVSRDELRARLWQTDTFVEFDDNLNAAIKRLREALGDSAEAPRYLETVPRRGYRFIPPVERVNGQIDGEPPVSAAVAAVAPVAARGTSATIPLLIAGVIVILGVAGLLWRSHRSRQLNDSRQLILAVLPFKNLSGQPEEEFVADGMTEEMIAQLSRLYPQKLRVIARTSTMRYKDRSADVHQIGGELGAGYILEGSVRRDDSDAFITAQLIQVSDQTHLWAETYHRPRRDIFTVQRDVARRVAESLALTLLPEQQAALARADTVDTNAYEAYLRGLFAWNHGTEAGFRTALASFQEALREDPQYAMAYAGLARTHFSLEDFHFESAAEARARADEAISKGLQLDASIPDLYVLKARMITERNDRGAEEAYRRAIELNLNNANAHLDYAMYLRGERRLGEALAEVDAAAELDPRSAWVFTAAGWILISANDLDRAAARIDQALRIDPNYPAAMYVMGRIKELEKDEPSTIDWFQKAVEASGRRAKYLHVLAIACANAGRHDEARNLLQELREMSSREYVDPDYIRSFEAALQSI